MELPIDAPLSHPGVFVSSIFQLQSEAQSNAQNLLQQQEYQLQRTLLFALIPVVVAFSFIIFIFYRSRREAFFKQKEAELKLSILTGELTALRAQMSPHFIFNCLNSIHHYMHSKSPAAASEYLVKFSQLIRYVLETSSARMVNLSDEIKALELYIQLEQLRLNNSFEYVIAIDNLATERIHVPPMLIQPLIENSIWHGLNNRSGSGKLAVTFALSGDMVKCTITDNGTAKPVIGPENPQGLMKKTSLGLSLINDRIKTINQIYKAKASFSIENLGDGEAELRGKQVELYMPYED